jgi:hypothetical protein
MKWLDEFRARRDAAWWSRWQREHRWDELAAYNTRRGQGIVHTPEYEARMRQEQHEFDVAHYGNDFGPWLRGMTEEPR